MNINPINFTSSRRDYERELPEKYLYPPKNLKYEYLNPLTEKEKPEPEIPIEYLDKISKIKGQIKALEEAEEKALSQIKAQQQEIFDDANKKISALNQQKAEEKALSQIKAQQQEIFNDANQKISALNQQKAEIQRQTSKLIFELEGTLRTLVTEELK